jgi:hypothetical protein
MYIKVPKTEILPKSFHCNRRFQAGREFYSFMIDFRDVPYLFDFKLDDDKRAQRKLNMTRVNKIARYLSDNNTDFVLPAVTASINVLPEFEENGHMTAGVLTIKKRMFTHDGQHRIAGIIQFLRDFKYKQSHPRKNSWYLKRVSIDHAIPVTLFVDAGLKRSRQIFCDINKNAVKPQKDLLTKFDHRTVNAEMISQKKQEIQEWLWDGFKVQFYSEGKSFTLIDKGYYYLYKGHYCSDSKHFARFALLDEFLKHYGDQTFYRIDKGPSENYASTKQEEILFETDAQISF